MSYLERSGGRSISDLFAEPSTNNSALTAVRLIRLVGLLREPKSFDDLRDNLGLGTRTVRRYLNRLRAAGFKIRYSRLYDSYRVVGFE